MIGAVWWRWSWIVYIDYSRSFIITTLNHQLSTYINQQKFTILFIFCSNFTSKWLHQEKCQLKQLGQLHLQETMFLEALAEEYVYLTLLQSTIPSKKSLVNTLIQPSQEKNALFSGLHSIKRNSTDEASAARRSSFHDAQAEPGFIGKMWHKYDVCYIIFNPHAD